jgi:NADPH-dependent curcumin reductase CurA
MSRAVARERRHLWSSRPGPWLIASSIVDITLFGALVSQYIATGLPDGLDRMNWLLGLMLRKRLTVRGFIVFQDFAPLYPQFIKVVGVWVAEGKIRYVEDIVDGLENASSAPFVPFQSA